jgi:tRNA A-37 threonylcarbamoyl transferase component Bud32
MTGRVIAGRYNLQHPIGRGAMGVVWRARDQLLDREVAIKEVVISALISADERRNAYQRTLREARTAARLSHRGVVTVYDVVEEDARPWIVMELVPSRSLDQLLTVEGRLSTARACQIGQQLLSALAAAHAAGVLHRDVKPSNVLISSNRTGEGWDERAVLTDFGIAQFEGDPRLTQTGMVMGSPGFTAPERIRGGDATPGSDLWSLGATIYAAVEGRGPYEQRGGAITTMSAIINEDAPIAPHAGRLAPLLAALLRRNPSARPSASAAARMFAQVLPQLPDTVDEQAATAHPDTVRSAYVAVPAASLATASPAVVPSATGRESEPEPRTDEAAEDAEAVEAVAESPAPEPRSAAQEEAESEAESEAEPEAESEAEPAHADATVVVPEVASVSALVAEPEAAAADHAASEQKAAATLLETRAVAEVTSGREADTVIPGREPVGYQRTELAIPTQPKAAKPSFTATRQADRAAPALSASSPAHPPSGQYGGPSQSYPDLAGQYPLGSGGGRAGRGNGGGNSHGRGHRRRYALFAVAVLVAAAAGVGAALALDSHHSSTPPTGGTGSTVADTPTKYKSVNALNNPTTARPANWQTVSRQAADLGTTAGFTIDVPPGWKETAKGLATEFNGPGNLLVKIDLTAQPTPNMVNDAATIEREAVAEHHLPGYKRDALESVPVKNTHGAVWKFTWTPTGSAALVADDILFAKPTSAGIQDYAVYISSPESTFDATSLPLFDQILQTFQVTT